MTTLSPLLTFLVEYLDLPAATSNPDARWEVFQLQHLNNSNLLAIDTKSRQVGWSWNSAAEAVASAVLNKRDTSIFVSINQDEAREKLRYARQIVEALDDDVRPSIVIDNQLELELSNGSRLISHPCRPVRGKARANVYLDEFAHYAKDREIYQSALPAASRGGRIRIGSSPLGAHGLFWEIFDQKLRAYPGYKRNRIPWWHVRHLCRDIEEAIKLAPFMMTEERVRQFGSTRLIELFDNMPLEDFQQEYECSWVDESESWITWDEIKRNQETAQSGLLWHRHAKNVDQAMVMIDQVAQATQDGSIESALAGGMDVGRKRDLTELQFVGRTNDGRMPVRLSISLSNVPFDEQQAVVTKAVTVLPVTQLLIDDTGMGMQIAETLHREQGMRVQGVSFTNANKELWAVETKVQMQRGRVPIPADRELSYQIHSIKKMTTAAKNITYDSGRSEGHHADKFWALALAIWAAKNKALTGQLFY